MSQFDSRTAARFARAVRDAATEDDACGILLDVIRHDDVGAADYARISALVDELWPVTPIGRAIARRHG